jgi:hypothetical protein
MGGGTNGKAKLYCHGIRDVLRVIWLSAEVEVSHRHCIELIGHVSHPHSYKRVPSYVLTKSTKQLHRCNCIQLAINRGMSDSTLWGNLPQSKLSIWRLQSLRNCGKMVVRPTIPRLLLDMHHRFPFFFFLSLSVLYSSFLFPPAATGATCPRDSPCDTKRRC